jgi:hypothetical protein
MAGEWRTVGRREAGHDYMNNKSTTPVAHLWNSQTKLKRHGAFLQRDNMYYSVYSLCSAYMETLQRTMDRPEDRPFDSNHLDEIIWLTSNSLSQIPRLPQYFVELLPKEEDEKIMLLKTQNDDGYKVRFTKALFDRAITEARDAGTSLLKNVSVLFFFEERPSSTFIVSMRLHPAGHSKARLFFPVEYGYERTYFCREKCGCELEDLFHEVSHLTKSKAFTIYTYGLAADGENVAIVGRPKEAIEPPPPPLPILWNKVSLGQISQYDLPNGRSACVLIACEAAIRLLNDPSLFPTEIDIDNIISKGVSEFEHSKRGSRKADHFEMADAQELVRYQTTLKFSMKKHVDIDSDPEVTRKMLMDLLDKNVGKALIMISQLKSFCVFVLNEERVYYVDSHPRRELHDSFEKGFALEFSSHANATDFLIRACPHTPGHYIMNLLESTVVELNNVRVQPCREETACTTAPVSADHQVHNNVSPLARSGSNGKYDDCAAKVGTRGESEHNEARLSYRKEMAFSTARGKDDVVMTNSHSAENESEGYARSHLPDHSSHIEHVKSSDQNQIDDKLKVGRTAHEWSQSMLLERQKSHVERAVMTDQGGECNTPRCIKKSTKVCSICRQQSCSRCLVHTVYSSRPSSTIPAIKYCWECASNLLKACTAEDAEQIKMALREWEKDVREDHERRTQSLLDFHEADIKRQINHLMNAFPDTLDAQEPNANMTYIEKQCLLDVVEMRRRSSQILIGSLNKLVGDLECKLNREHHLPLAPPVWALPEGEE